MLFLYRNIATKTGQGHCPTASGHPKQLGCRIITTWQFSQRSCSDLTLWPWDCGSRRFEGSPNESVTSQKTWIEGIVSLLSKPRLHYCSHQTSPLVPLAVLLNPVHALVSYFTFYRFNIITVYTSMSPRRTRFFLRPSEPPRFHHPKRFGVQHKSWSSSLQLPPNLLLPPPY